MMFVRQRMNGYRDSIHEPRRLQSETALDFILILPYD